MEFLLFLILSCMCMNLQATEDNERILGASIVKRQVIFQARPCVTADRQTGLCSPIARCPQLMLDLSKLRRSVCMQNLIVLGVCCPIIQMNVSIGVGNFPLLSNDPEFQFPPGKNKINIKLILIAAFILSRKCKESKDTF